jgi:hypothetical protein
MPEQRLTYANIVSTVALVAAVVGSLYAASVKSGRVDRDRPPATESQANAATFTFGGEQRVAIGQQPTLSPPCCVVPGAGLVEVGSGTGRVVQLTHYGYGTTIRTLGRKSRLFEFFLGDRGDPEQAQLSVRNNGNGTGASVQARNASDTGGILLDFGNALRPRLYLEQPEGATGVVLGIDNPLRDGSIALATQTNGKLTNHLVVDSSGRLRTDGDAHIGDKPTDRVVFHGAAGSGAQGRDPGPLRTGLTAADANTPAKVAALISANRHAMNALRDTLRAHGLISER